MRRYRIEFVMLASGGAEDVNVFKKAALTTNNLLSGQPGEDARIVEDRLLLTCDTPDKGAAYRWALNIAAQFSKLISMKTGQHLTPVFSGLDSIPGEAGQSILPSLPIGFWADTYDPDRFQDDAVESGLACSLADELMGRSLEYFQRGLFYRRVVWRLIHPSSPDRIFAASEATLNFYKAVEVILGDNPAGPRSKALQLDRELRRRIQHLRKRRTDRDVAHSSLDPGDLDVVMSTVAGSQEIARKVIEAYVDFLQAGESLVEITPTKRSRRRRGR